MIAANMWLGSIARGKVHHSKKMLIFQIFDDDDQIDDDDDPVAVSLVLTTVEW